MTEQKEAANKIFKNMRKMPPTRRKGRRARGGAGGSSDDDGGSDDDDDDDDESSEEEESDSEDSSPMSWNRAWTRTPTGRMRTRSGGSSRRCGG